ncbi:MAG: hypothetical protein M1813_003692 [Trichoglossum hirsutum]|nr:MAG: hypothetical protein M1813_003692 [Trichoglossum hirsutum]
MADANTAVPKCANCAKTESELSGINLKRCAKCLTTNYCSRECQKTDWKKHKRVCASTAASATSPSESASAEQPPKGLSVVIDKPFHRLDTQTWLHDRPEQDVYKLLIDTYRFRMEDDYNLEGITDADSIYGGARDSRQGFRRFLHLAEGRRRLLPSWWSQEKAAECEAVGVNDGWSSLASKIEKSNVIEHYGDPNMPMQLRMFGEQVYGRGPGGQSGAAIRRVQMVAERGEGYTSQLDMSSMFRRA